MMAIQSFPAAVRAVAKVYGAGVLGLFLLTAATPAPARTDLPDAVWNPVASERLIKLPGTYLKKAVEHDFANSGLAASLRDAESLMQLKAATLQDLQAAIDQADGELKIELRHQLLAEKRAYLELVGRHQDFRRQQMATKSRLYERLLAKLGREAAAMTPARQALVEKQEEARRRLDRTIAKVDMKLFSAPMSGQSKYSKEYAKNVVAIERLLEAVKAHPMNAQAELNGQPVTKKEYLRQLVAETQAELAIVEQEETILGYMAKLVSLDAMALSEAVASGREELLDGVAEPETTGIAAAVDFFVPQ